MAPKTLLSFSTLAYHAIILSWLIQIICITHSSAFVVKLPLVVSSSSSHNNHKTTIRNATSKSQNNYLADKLLANKITIPTIRKKIKAPIPLSEELGCSPTLFYNYFDPLNFCNEENFVQYREAELKHGRVAMLATIGNIMPWILKRQGLLPGDLYLSPSNDLKFVDMPCGIKAITVVPLLGWVQIITLIAFLEVKVFIQKDKRDMPGDYGIGYFGLRDKSRHERSLRSELENGRLAMIAFLGQIVAELVTGYDAGEQAALILNWK